jgi:hypothetical protein
MTVCSKIMPQAMVGIVGVSAGSPEVFSIPALVAEVVLLQVVQAKIQVPEVSSSTVRDIPGIQSRCP